MKKSIVLLMSLFYIAAISVLILKNLEDTDSYIGKQNSKFAKTQILFLLDNIKQEVSRAIKASNEADIKEDYLSDYYNILFPLKINDIDISFILKPYSKVNINVLKNKEYEKYKDLNDLFTDNRIYDFDYFIQIYRQKVDLYLKDSYNNEIANQKQLDEMIDLFVKETYSDSILEIKDKIGFFDFNTEKAQEEKRYDYYELTVKINYLKEFVKAHYILNKEGKVENFEFSFK
ncbi:MAG: hypothetical protein WC141_05310 [Arcobacteraceae bacterium]